MRYWFVRSPFRTRRWDDILLQGVFRLYGIRNYTARKNIEQMQRGDIALWYSSSAGKMIYGAMRVKEKAFKDPTSSDKWLSVDFIPEMSFSSPVSLKSIRKNKIFKDSDILKLPRVSVIEISKKEYHTILMLGTNNI